MDLCLMKQLKHHDIELTFITINKLCNNLNPKKQHNTDKNEKTGVYKVTCLDCPSMYAISTKLN